MSLQHAQQVHINDGSPEVQGTLLRIPLPVDEIAVVRKVTWTFITDVNVDLGADRIAVGAISHDHALPATDNQHFWLGQPFVWSAFSLIMASDGTVDPAGAFMEAPNLVDLFPMPGYWIGGDQMLVTTSNFGETITILCRVWFTTKRVSLGTKALVVERTVLVVNPESR